MRQQTKSAWREINGSCLDCSERPGSWNRAPPASPTRSGTTGRYNTRKAMSDALQEARELEDLQFAKRLQRLLEEQRQRDAAIDADMNRRGRYRSGPRGKAILESRARTTRELIDGSINAHRELAAKFPALGSPPELEALRAKLQKWIDGLENRIRSRVLRTREERFRRRSHRS
jgi:hypothetical protein